MTSARSVCMTVSRASGAGLYGVGSIALSGEKVMLAILVFRHSRRCVGFRIKMNI